MSNKSLSFMGVVKKAYRSLNTVSSGVGRFGAGGHAGGYGGLIRDPWPGAWQKNEEIRCEDVLSYSPVFACITLIASDIAKLPLNSIGYIKGVWSIIEDKELTRLLRKPNQFQNRIQFIENWLISKLSTGNTYVLIRRNADGTPKSLHVLDPCLVTVLVSDDGSVFYTINADNLMGTKEPITVPASEIIHDRFNCLYHPLVGISPIYACAIAAGQGLAIQEQSTKFFRNGSRMAGILSSPTAITNDTAERLKKHWEENYTGPNSAGKVAVAGDGLKFESQSMAAADAQLIEQLGWTAETVCAAFHVPPYKVGVGSWPPYTDVQSGNMQYYAQALQILIECMELGVDLGLELDALTGVEFDVRQLLRMDSMSQATVLTTYTGAGILKLDEARNEIGRSPMEGGDAAYLQQQNYSVTALAKRDAREDLWDKKTEKTEATVTAPEPKPVPPAKAKSIEYDENVIGYMFANAITKERKAHHETGSN